MTNLRQAAKAVVDRWDTPAWEWRDQGPTADLMADLRTALAQPEQEPTWVGCGECDCSFPCTNGQTRCIRLKEKP